MRGRVGQAPMTLPFVQKIVISAANVLLKNEKAGCVVIGKDTRESCDQFEAAIISGLSAKGIKVISLGIIPTPAVPKMLQHFNADFGVMISASHNPYYDNGIKFFAGNGYKLSDEQELEIEALIDQRDEDFIEASPKDFNDESKVASSLYSENILRAFAQNLDLSGLKIVIDCAHGAAFKIAPKILKDLGAGVIPIGVEPDGRNINENCGAVHTALLQRTVIEQNADLGIALDGDADRLIMVDENGKQIDGDQLMGLVAIDYAANGQLAQNALVATVMSNLGLERVLENRGIKLYRASVGDRFVMEAMKTIGANIGGEQSGHIIFLDESSSGDGLLSALNVLQVLGKKNQPFSQAAHVFDPVPQILKNIEYDRAIADPLGKKQIQEAMNQAEFALKNINGRLLVRLSGTEPKIRVMAEADDKLGMEQIVEKLVRDMKGMLVA